MPDPAAAFTAPAPESPEVPFVACRELRIGYGAKTVVHGIGLSWDGDCRALALTGANGSGKSTFLKTCLGLLRPLAGDLRVLGIAAGRPGFQGVLRTLGWVHQQRSPGVLRLRVRELVDLGLGPRTGANAPDRDSGARAVLGAMEACGVAGLAETAVQDLSGGQFQRASIARALAGAPRLLFLDEPTTFLDRESRRSVLALLSSLRVSSGPAFALVSHDPELVALCDRFWIFEDGTAREADRSEAVSGCS